MSAKRISGYDWFQANEEGPPRPYTQFHAVRVIVGLWGAVGLAATEFRGEG